MIVGWSAGVLLGVAAAMALIRLIRGPSTLDRVVALDVLVAIALCARGVEAALNRHGTTLPILIALSLVGFVGAISVARVVARGPHRPNDASERADDPASGHGGESYDRGNPT